MSKWSGIDPVSFITTVLRDPETRRPFVLLPAEIAFLEHALETDDDGRLLHPELVYSAIKKSGKTAFAAIFLITLIVLLGGRYAEGFVVANDLEQAQSRVFEMVRRIIEASPLLRREAKITANKITFPSSGSSITALASNYESAAGAHPCIACFDELWGYTSERSRRLWDEMVSVPTRKISCRLTVTHAGFSAESQLLEELYNRGLAQPKVGTDLYAGDGLLMFWSHVPIAPWQDSRWLADMRRSLRPNQFSRMIENRFVSTDFSFIDLSTFDACVDPDQRPLLVDRALPVWCAIDASVKHDFTAIVAVAWDREQQKVRLVAHKIFQPSPERPIDFEGAVEHTLLTWQSQYQIRAALFDPFQMVAVAQRLTRAGIRMD